MRKLTAIFILCLLSSFHTLSAQETQEKSKSTKSTSEEYTKFRFGGYGEIVANSKIMVSTDSMVVVTEMPMIKEIQFLFHALY